MTTAPLYVNEGNLSVAWARAFEAVLHRGLRGLAPLIVNVTHLEEDPLPEVPAIRACLDETLRREGHGDCNTVANTIFPLRTWEKSRDRQELYRRYLKMVPRIKRLNRANHYGVYFERMIQYGSGPEAGNQLEHLIEIWGRKVRRPSAYQVNIFDPARDHTRQPLRGFPCLQHVSFTPLGRGKLAVVATYPSQYLFERAYGNYLGLCRLGRFLADELDLELTQLTCMIGIGLPGDTNRTTLRGLAEAIRPHLPQHESQRAAMAGASGG